MTVTLMCSHALGCFGELPGEGSGAEIDPACQIQSEEERSPGYPYNLDLYTTQVLPVVKESCAAVGCHGAPAGSAGFTVWPEAAEGNCDYAKTFNSLKSFVDLTTPQNSRVYVAVSGAKPGHFAFAPDDPKLATLLSYVTDASSTYISGGGNSDTAPPGASPFDYTVFQDTIQPILDTAENRGCTLAGCHGTGAGGFTVTAQPARDSAEMEANFLAVTQRSSVDNPAASLFLLKAENRHSGSSVISPEQSQQILAWIEDARANAGNGGNDVTNCPPLESFNLAVFRDEILPILSGDLDLNGGRITGCTTGPCHGQTRGPGTLTLQREADAATNLKNFACFVNLANPSGSEILACPLNDRRCRRYPHPGQDAFAGAEDLNYQRVLAFLYGAKADATPLDFAFFVRRINTIFNDPNAVEAGAQNRTCADLTACHGIRIAGQSPPNGSNFAIIPNASDPARLALDFVAASAFTNFLNPRQSSLFLYPTNEIANIDANPLATGLPHPGGADFAVDSLEAQAILQWVGGLRPDSEGFQRNWLVAGDYPAAQITDLTFIDEVNATPRIFDPTGVAQFNNGQWDGLFSDNREVNLDQAFPRNQTTGRIAYASAYVLNTTPSTLRVQITVSSPNALRLYVGSSVNQSDGGRVTALVDLPSFAASGTATRILVKVFQRASDSGFRFDMELRDELGNILSDRTGELVFKLSPEGGI